MHKKYPLSLLTKDGYKATIKSVIDKTGYTINRFKEIHSDRFDYSKTKYTGSLNKLIVTCKIHGDFYTTIDSHINGLGCKRCSLENSKKNTLSFSGCEEAGLKSNKFSGFKLYIIECYNDNERFIKIGKTYHPIQSRFNGIKLPYNFFVLKIINGSATYISILEIELQNKFKEYKYIPNNKFNGMYECFNSNILKDINNGNLE